MATNSFTLASCFCKCLGSPREWRIGWIDSCVCNGSVQLIACNLTVLRPQAPKKTSRGLCGHMSVGGSNDYSVNADERFWQSDCNARKSNSEVECHVETVSWRERRIKASIWVKAPEKVVWEVLTDYERLAEFIPNLVCSERIPCPYPGRIWLLQRGMQRAMYWNIEARVVLDLEELSQLETGSELRFSMVDGDFKRYEGRWYLRVGPRPQTTMLHYEVNVVPKLLFPAAFVESIIKADLPKNLCALAKRAEISLKSESVSSVVPKAVPLRTSNGISLTSREVSAQSSTFIDVDNKDSLPSTSKSKTSDGKIQVSKDTLPSTSKSKTSDRKIEVSKDADEAEIGSSSERSRDLNASDWYWCGTRKTCQLGHQCVADEIHFRRLDDLLENGGVHRQVVATITVKAPPKDVWAVLTAYESLPEFVPNLANSEILFRDNKRVRLLQEGCKCLLYMVLHGRVVLDLWEQPDFEIKFKQVEGDFDSFQGKWMLKQFGSQHTLLKYVVDTKIRKDCFLAESIVEEVIYEDLPSNLCAIRDRVESLVTSTGPHISHLEAAPKAALADFEQLTSLQRSPAVLQAEGTASVLLEESEFKLESSVGKNSLNSTVEKIDGRRLHKSGLKDDFQVLEKEIKDFIARYGIEGVMPLRNSMRKHKRIDLEKAITAMGGFRTIAARMKLSLAYEQRKPDGYWDKLQNLRNEVTAFQKEIGDELTIMPSRKSMERRGRYDLARALEKWGGVNEVSRILGLTTKKMGRPSQISPSNGGVNEASRILGLKTKKMGRPSRISPSNADGLEKVKPVSDKATSSDAIEESHNLLATPSLDETDGLSQQAFQWAITASSSDQKEASLHVSKKTADSCEELPEDQPENDITFNSNGTEEPPQHPLTSLAFSSGNQGKHKKMPYKTDVPQESPKWLTLLTEAQSNLENE